MNQQQQRVVDSFARVRSFVAAHPSTGTLTDTSAREMLDDVVRKLGEYAGAQRFGLEQSSAESWRRGAQAELLFVRYIRPIVAIAHAQIEPRADAGLPADFLAAFARERNELERLRNERATQVVTHLMARTDIKAQIVRGRRAVVRQDPIVRESMLNDRRGLAAWRAAKRVHLRSGGAGPRAEAVDESVPADATAGVPESLRRIPGQPLDALHGLRVEGGLDRQRIVRPMARQHGRGGGVKLGRLPCHVGARAAPLLRGVAGELHPVDRKHLAADQALRVGEQHDLQQHRRRVRRGARLVIPEAGVEMGEVDHVTEQVVERMLQRAGPQLRRQIDGQEPRVRVDVLVTGHGGDSTTGGADRTFFRRS